MKILCLEQGDWIKSTEFPSNGRDWEARRHADFDISPNRRARDTDYPVNDDNSVMKIANFNGVGGGTILFMAHYPRVSCGRSRRNTVRASSSQSASHPPPRPASSRGSRTDATGSVERLEVCPRVLVASLASRLAIATAKDQSPSCVGRIGAHRLRPRRKFASSISPGGGT
jgi:hypothetical protein